ncbi:Non-reducing polyketide synthase ascC [Cladobotryum mycophilum]|uniref:Non-reducing polyketide synthase ascC n=1 Tax=Cladobotryum mycophilum TaxID=491253 RepID=A0ABR0SH76_9HYPO
MSKSAGAISAAIFSPQGNAPKSSYLSHVRTRLLQEPALKPLLDAVVALPETWRSLATSRQDVARLRDGRQLIQSFPDWIETGKSDIFESEMSAMITLPLLITTQVVQYFEYLKKTGSSHSELLESLQDGGIQGYCIGLLSAVIVASARDERELAKFAATAIRIALAIGAFGDLGESSPKTESNTVAIRLRNKGDGEELVQKFPGAYISTITDSRSISVIAPADQIASLRAYAEESGLYPKVVHLRSNLHNPSNTTLAEDCSEWCSTLFPFPSSDDLQVPVRSNITGESLTKATHSLSSELVKTVLASLCDWSLVMRSLALDLQRTGQRQHTLALFGLSDSVPLTIFQQHEVQITKIDAQSLHNSVTTPNNSIKSFPPDAIAVVGAACRLPGADTLEDLWNIISQGESRLEPLREDRVKIKESYRATQDSEWTKKRTFYGNFIDDVDAFDHSFFGISPREAKYMDPQQRLLLTAAFQAMDSSGYLRHHVRERGDAVGCFLGASYTEYVENTSAYSPSAFTATGTIRAFLSGKISYHFGWTGPSEVIDTACSASIVAVNRACKAINAGECNMALAGGVNIITGLTNYFDLGKASFLSQTGQCKPFDDSADGYCRADGVGLVVLKSLAQAVADGDHIMGVIPAIATNQGGIHAPSITVPDGVAQKALYKHVLAKSGIPAERVTYVEAHGTGTQAGDPIEIASVREVFGGSHRINPLYMGSLKANIGHSETAAGVASLLKVLTMLRHEGVPPMQGFKKLNHKIPALETDKMAIPTKLTPWTAGPRVACVNSYGASGSNSALLCSEWIEEKTAASNGAGVSSAYPILLSAASEESLQRYLKDLAAHISRLPDDMRLDKLAYTLSERRKHHAVRWSTSVSDLSSLVEQLHNTSHRDFVEVPKTPKTVKKVVLTFSGQSKINIGLDPVDYQTNPRFFQYIEICNDILQSFGCPDIRPFLSEAGPIDDPVILQCGTVAVQYASAKCWIDGGLKVDAIVGHSLGELSALAVSGVLSLQDALNVVYQRARLIKAKWGPDRGTMLAIHAKIDTVRSILEFVNTTINDDEDMLEIACYNSYTSHVVVGKESSIAMAEKIIQHDPRLAEKIIQQDSRYHGLRYQRLNVSHGFHSRFTEPLLQDLIKLANSLEFKEPTIPLETSTQTQLGFSTKDPTYIANHARDPVYFVDAVRRLEQKLGACVWVEAGLNTPIVAMAKKAVEKPEIHSFQAVASPAAAAAGLWREGIANTFWSFITPKASSLSPIWLPPYNFDRPKYWLDHVDRAIEAQKAAQAIESTTVAAPEKQTLPLVSYNGPLSSDGSSHQFKFHTTTERYMRIVKGHAVRKKPLCPASMYMEASVMGADKLGVQLRGKTITFQNIQFHRPLGCDDGLDVKLLLDRTSSADGDSWHYNVQSAPKAGHSEGDFSTSSAGSLDLELYEMLVADKIASLRSDPLAERLKTKTAYSLFSRVVGYSDLMQGISSITLGTKEALAKIKVPKATWATTSESTVSDYFDAVTLDTFIQVLGLLINTTTHSDANDEIYVASSIGKMVIAPTDFHKDQTWSVYATYSTVDSKLSSGAIFVFDESKKLVSFGTKIQFMKVQAAKLERILETVNPRRASVQLASTLEAINPRRASIQLANALEIVNQRRQSVQWRAPPLLEEGPRVVFKNVFEDVESPKTKTGGAAPILNICPATPERGANTHDVEELKSLISAYTGIKVADIHDDESFSSMGVDSLASIELSDELEAKFGISVNTDDLLTGDVKSLIALFPSSSSSSAATAITTAMPTTGNRLPTIESTSPTETDDSCSEASSSEILEGSSTYNDQYTAVTTPMEPYSRSNAGDYADEWKRPKAKLSSRHKVETVVYKKIDGVEIPADLYIPTEAPANPMPVALMIHGGGHMTLSRKAVRPPQTNFLLANGIFPVSLDYRLCPQVNVLDGPMTDVRDACAWVQKDLAQIMASRGITIDPSKYVVIGWSTGGTLAMTTSWTVPQAGLTPPLAVLSFYCPVEYNPEEPITMGKEYPPRSMALSKIRDALPSELSTFHAFNTFDTTRLGWVQEGDPRSELVLALVKEDNGMSLLFNGIPTKGDELPRADPKLAAAFSPLVQVKKGNYNVPTFLITGDEDEIVPFSKCEEFGNALKESGIKSGFLPVRGAKHIFDLRTTPGSEAWDKSIGPGYEFILKELETASSSSRR